MKISRLVVSTILSAALACLTAGTALAADVSIMVLPSLAPNAYGSPSWSGYMANAQYALQNGLTNYGDRSMNPTAYQVFNTISASQLNVTSYASWDGVANPAAPFNNEYGTRLHFGAFIKSDVAFSLNEVTFAIVSNDSGNTLGYADDLVGTNFGSGSRVGIYYGADGTKGTADDVTYNAYNVGSDASLINELFYVGAGNAYWPGYGDPNAAQGAIDDSTAWISANVSQVSATYSLNLANTAYSGSANVAVTPVPLPAAVWTGMALLGAMGGLKGLKRLRTARA